MRGLIFYWIENVTTREGAYWHITVSLLTYMCPSFISYEYETVSFLQGLCFPLHRKKRLKIPNGYSEAANRFDLIWSLMFNATFSNISAISWWPVLVVEEAGIPERTTDHGQATSKLVNRVHPFCNLQSRLRTHIVLVIVLYEFLGNPTT